MILPPPPKPPVIIGVLKRGSDGQVYRLKEGVNTFGRDDASMDFTFPSDKYMSGKHFLIEVIKKGDACEYRITDLGSSHGTTISSQNGGMALTNKYAHSPQSAFLEGGERIIAGKTKFEFII
jgi:hypothetical protein